MPELTVEVIPVCAQWASNFQVNSDKGEKKYLVQFTRYEQPTCNCPAYQFSGDHGSQTCKHIKRVREHGCFWSDGYFGEMGAHTWISNSITILSTTPDTLDGEECPGCGGEMVAIAIAV